MHAQVNNVLTYSAFHYNPGDTNYHEYVNFSDSIPKVNLGITPNFGERIGEYYCNKSGVPVTYILKNQDGNDRICLFPDSLILPIEPLAYDTIDLVLKDDSHFWIIHNNWFGQYFNFHSGKIRGQKTKIIQTNTSIDGYETVFPTAKGTWLIRFGNGQHYENSLIKENGLVRTAVGKYKGFTSNSYHNYSMACNGSMEKIAWIARDGQSTGDNPYNITEINSIWQADFDKESGHLSNMSLLRSDTTKYITAFRQDRIVLQANYLSESIEFSPNGRFLYSFDLKPNDTGENDLGRLMQYDLVSGKEEVVLTNRPNFLDSVLGQNEVCI